MLIKYLENLDLNYVVANRIKTIYSYTSLPLARFARQPLALILTKNVVRNI